MHLIPYIGPIVPVTLSCYVLFAIFTKGNNFCNFQFASLEEGALSQGDELLKGRILP